VPKIKERKKVAIVCFSPPFYPHYYEFDVPENQQLRCGIRIFDELFCPILEEWIRLNGLLARSWADVGDVPWWYNERASISLLAGAIWNSRRSSGDYAFEEYASVKRKERKNCAGRLDLEFCFSKQHFVAEAKQCWIPISKGGDNARRIKDALARAKADVRRCSPPAGMRKLAVVFGVPYVARARSTRQALRASINSFVEEARAVDADAIAWTFPKLNSMPTISGFIYPGVVVWIKEVKGRKSGSTLY
jgi:hypothetical protein